MPVRLVSIGASEKRAEAKTPASVEPSKLELDDPRWESFVAETSAATPFHHPAWARMISRAYGYRAFAIVITDDGGTVRAGAPFLEVRSLSRRRRWVSLPFTDECPPLARDAESADALTTALGLAHERLRAPLMELRGEVHGVGWRTSADAVTHTLELESVLDRWRKQFSQQTVRNIKRAQRDGVTVRRAAESRDLDALYRLHTDTRRRQGVPVQPRRFFELIWSDLVERDLGFILLADVPDAEAVAGAVFLRSGGTTVYKFGASDVGYLSFRPNHLLMWTAIQDACARGDHRFDFGRSDLNNPGLRVFKSGWGATERPLSYSRLAPGAASGSEGLASRGLSFVIRKGPTWLCRSSGAALYRYAGSR